MRLIIVSDTHGLHEALGVLEGDVLVHCGDGTELGHEEELDELDDWFGRQAVQHVLAIGGNHDFAIEHRLAEGRPVFRHATYLQDQGVNIAGVRFWGAPWTPDLQGWAFYANRAELGRRWDAIPPRTEVLITHSPPAGILDQNSRGTSCGCPSLLDRVRHVAPRVHCFGHIHASGGVVDRETRFVNAAVMHRGGLRAPVVVDL